MKKEIPKLNLGLYKDGLRINSKKFNPLNMSFGCFGIESDKVYKAVDPMDLLESLYTVNVEDAGKMDKVKLLKNMLEKLNP